MNLYDAINPYMSSHSVALFLAYLLTGALLWVAFNWIYTAITPHDDEKLLGDGNISCAVALVGAEIGFMIPFAVASLYGGSWLGFVLWAILAGAIQIGMFALMYWRYPAAITVDNRAKAIVMAGASVCAGIVNAAAMIP